jgi:hypothetical protein
MHKNHEEYKSLVLGRCALRKGFGAGMFVLLAEDVITFLHGWWYKRHAKQCAIVGAAHVYSTCSG